VTFSQKMDVSLKKSNITQKKTLRGGFLGLFFGFYWAGFFIANPGLLCNGMDMVDRAEYWGLPSDWVPSACSCCTMGQ
jgi:hypothetical protein